MFSNLCKKIAVFLTVAVMFIITAVQAFAYGIDENLINGTRYFPPVDGSMVPPSTASINYFIYYYSDNSAYYLLYYSHTSIASFSMYSGKLVFGNTLSFNLYCIDEGSWEWKFVADKNSISSLNINSAANFPEWNIVFSTTDLYMSGNVIYPATTSGVKFVTQDELTTIIGQGIGGGGISLDSIFDGVKDVINGIGSLANSIAEGFKNLGESIGRVFNAIKDGFDNLIESIKDLPKKIEDGFLETLKFLFIPTGEPFQKTKELLESKFPLLAQVLDLMSSFLKFKFDEKPPDLNITVFGVSIDAFDWNVFEMYRPKVHGIIMAVCSYITFRRFLKKLPNIIRGG